MTAVRHDDVAPVAPAPVLTLQPAPKRRPHHAFFGGDPLVNAATQLLSIPVRQVYAVLWRVGIIEVRV
jgi:hypothetical protein